MSDTLNQLLQPRAGALPAPVVANPLAAIGGAAETAGRVMNLRNQQGQQLWGQALQQATDANGNVDFGKAQSIAAGMGPAAAMAASANLQANASMRGQQINNAAGIYKTTGIAALSVAKDSSDGGVNSAFDNMIASGLPATEVNAERQRVLAMSPTDRQNYAVQHGLAVLDQLHQVIGQTTLQNIGGTAAPVTLNQPTANASGSATLGPGSIPITPTPGEVLGGPSITSPATQADVQAGRASAVGQNVTIPAAEVYRRAGLPVPPGLLTGGGGGGGGAVVGADGKPVSPANPPRLLKVPGQPNAPSPQPAPPGTATGAPATGGNVGFGAAVGGSAAAPGAALPVSPIPPPNAPPSPPAPGTPIWNPNNPVGTSTLQAPAPPGPVAAAQATAKATGRPAPVAGSPGLVANPNGSIGPPGGSGFRPPAATPPPPTLPPNAPTAALQGGVPVASTNALAPNLGAPSAPSPLVPGDVNAIMAGINRTRGTPVQGTQTAFNTIATGPGTEEAQGYKTSADKLAADNVAAANFQSTQFPYIQALKTYGEGTTTGPTSDFWNQVAGTIRTPLAKLGLNIGNLDDNTQRQDALGKWLANIQSGNPMSGKSDAELAQVLKGSASTHINETTGADMVKAGLSLQRMNVAATREWNNNPALQQQYGTYLNYLGNYNTTTDPRAFAVDTYNPTQIARLRTQLQNGSEADAQRFESSLALARRNGVIGGAGSQAMP